LILLKIFNMYTPNPINTTHIQLNDSILSLSEILAKNTHEVWASKRLAESWSYGAVRNDEKKHHPCLIPYEELSEIEKEYDRATSQEALKVILSLGYDINLKN